MNVENPSQVQASAEFTEKIIAKLADKKGVHAETAISAASRMAGTFLLRSTGLPIAGFAPGSFRAILQKHNLTAREGAYAAAVSTAVLIQKSAGVLDPRISYTIAAWGIVEGCKTVPLNNRVD